MRSSEQIVAEPQIEKDQIERAVPRLIDGVAGVADGSDVVAIAVQAHGQRFGGR